MTQDEIYKANVPIIMFDKELEKFRGQVLFNEKLARANVILAKAGLPEGLAKRKVMFIK